MSGASVIVLGATGLVGGHAVSIALEDPAVGSVTVIGRRPCGHAHPTLREVIHQDFTDFGPVTDALTGHDAALFCVGAYSGKVPDDRFRAITVDMPIAFARALHEHSPAAAFCLLSGQGADPTGRSRVAFARYKGEAETKLRAVGFDRVHIVRPGYIYPVEPRDEPNLGYRIMRALYPVIRRIAPGSAIPSDDLARVMVHAGLQGTGTHDDPVLENRDIRALAATLT